MSTDAIPREAQALRAWECHKRIFGVILLLVALDMVGGFSESLKPKTATAPRSQTVPAQARINTPAFGLLPQERLSHR